MNSFILGQGEICKTLPNLLHYLILMSTRAARVAKEMQRQLSVILRDDLKDPRIGFTTITGVTITDDLRSAKVYFTTLGGGVQENNALVAFNRANGFIRRLIGQRIDLRLVPEIVFKLDKGISSGFTVDEILRQLEEEKSASPPEADKWQKRGTQ